MEEVEILKISDGAASAEKDVVSVERPFTIYLFKTETATLLCSPSNLKELAAGFLFSSGIINKASDLKEITLDESAGRCWVETPDKMSAPNAEMLAKRMYTSGCGKGVLFYSAADLVSLSKNESGLKIRASEITNLVSQMNAMSIEFKKTGGTHSASFAVKGKVEVFMEDIGRHNAVDKVIGGCLLGGLDMNAGILFTTGRASSEILFKTAKCGTPVLVSGSAPTDQAVKIALNAGITLIGFARGKRLNVYSGKERVIL